MGLTGTCVRNKGRGMKIFETEMRRASVDMICYSYSER